MCISSGWYAKVCKECIRQHVDVYPGRAETAVHIVKMANKECIGLCVEITWYSICGESINVEHTYGITKTRPASNVFFRL